MADEHQAVPNPAPPDSISDSEGVRAATIPPSSEPQTTATDAAPQEPPEPKTRSKAVYLVVGLLLVVIIGVLVGFTVIRPHQKQVTQHAVQKSAQTYEQVMATAKKQDYNSDFKGEIVTLKQYLATKPSQQQANDAAMKLATAYINLGDHDQAITYYKQVQSTNDSRYTIPVLNGLAIAYTMKKDNAMAVQYYQQVIAAYKAQNSQYDVSSYQKIIQSLQQKQ